MCFFCSPIGLGIIDQLLVANLTLQNILRTARSRNGKPFNKKIPKHVTFSLSNSRICMAAISNKRTTFLRNVSIYWMQILLKDEQGTQGWDSTVKSLNKPSTPDFILNTTE
ncbi:hypothetical protein NPIL_118321 [Nephila pilipes]|uniref:Uncharacterized protein n=1 Tax=Nephila pilipes TaxID=299642 RepID=A0A8X6U2S6_NEPPI|nr:hypothetical protein NPIL_118321 [Nephila pilipes]